MDSIPGSTPSVFGESCGAKIIMLVTTTLLKEERRSVSVSFYMVMVKYGTEIVSFGIIDAGFIINFGHEFY